MKLNGELIKLKEKEWVFYIENLEFRKFYLTKPLSMEKNWKMEKKKLV